MHYNHKKAPRGVLVFGLEIVQHFIHFVGVDLVAQPGNAVTCVVFAELIDEAHRPLAITKIFAFFGVAVDGFIVANPKGSIPGLVVGPTVVGCVGQGGSGQNGLVSCTSVLYP